MKKNYPLFIAFFLLLITGFAQYSSAQTTETFESYTSGKPTSFISNSQSFDLITANCGRNEGGKFGIFIPGQNWFHCTETMAHVTSTGNGFGVGVSCASAAACGGSSNKFIDNGSAPAVNQIYAIKTSNAASFTIKSIYVYVSADKAATSSTVTGGATFRGKKSGVTLFTFIPVLTANSNGFTFVDFVTAGYGSVNIDEIEIQGGATINYVSLDNFTWGSSAASTTINSIVRASATNPTNQSSVTYTATFGASVTGVNTGNFSLSTTGTIAGASVTNVSGSGSTYTVTVNTGSGSGDIGLNLANTAGISSSISTTLPFSGQAYTIDKAAPVINSVNSSTNNGTYKLGDIVSVQVNFSKNVTVTGTPRLTLETGAIDQPVNYSGGSGTSTLTFNYTVAGGDNSSDLDYISTIALALNGGTIRDAVGNDAVLTLASPGAINSLGNNKAIVIDGIVPTVTSVSVPSNGTYKLGDNLDFVVNFSEAVTITGTPQIALTIGSSSLPASYVSGSGTSAITFRYTVLAGHLDNNGIAIGVLGANGGSLRDVAGNNATLTLNSVPSTVNVLVDGVVPVVTSVNSSTVNGAYKIGETISIQVNFSKNVTVTNTPQLTLETGATDKVVNYTTGSGTSTLNFTYTITSGDLSSDLDYASTTALALNGATIRDASGNNAVLTLPAPGAANSLGNNKSLVIDGVAPTVLSVNSTTANGSYKVGSIISIQVNFSENVTLVESPTLRLRFTSGNRYIDYTSGSGSSVLTFNYTVLAGDASADLDYFSTGALAVGETIRDAAGNDAVLTLPAPGAAGSLGASKNIVIDGVAPTLAITSSAGASGATTVTAPVPFTFTFSEIVTGFAQEDIAVTNGTIASFSGSGISYNITVTPSATGNITVNVTAGKAIDAAGNENTAASQFSINYQGILPVRLISYTAKPEANAAKLEWATESESNNQSFGIFRSANGKDFLQIGTVAGSGTTATKHSYYFYDRQPLKGTNYYQLIQTDFNGTSKELGIRSVDFELAAKGKLLMVPNPAVAQTKVVFPLGTNKIELVDLLGKVLKSIKVSPLEVEQTFTVSSFATATYLVRSYGNYGVLSTKFIKVN